jgi:hypothetical protein
MTGNLIFVGFCFLARGGRGGRGERFDEFCSDCFAAFKDLRISSVFVIA